MKQTPYATSQTGDPIVWFYVWAISSAYDEVALTKEEEKVSRKNNTLPRKNHPSTTKNQNYPEYSLPELLTVQRSILPYIAQTDTWYWQIRKVRRDLNIQQEETIWVQKRNNRWLCLPSKANTYLRQGKQVKININNITLSYAKKRTMSEEIRNRI